MRKIWIKVMKKYYIYKMKMLNKAMVIANRKNKNQDVVFKLADDMSQACKKYIEFEKKEMES